MNDPTLLVFEVIGIWASGFATVAAVIVALRLRRRYERLERPELSVEFDSRRPSDQRYLPPKLTGANREELWIRLRVRNIGNSPAEDVQLRFIGVQREGDKTLENRPSWWFKVSNLNTVFVAIPPKFPQYFDLAYVRNDVGSREDVCFYLVIVRGDLHAWPEEKTRIEQDDDNNKLEIGLKYDLFFAVVSGNADSKYYRMAMKVGVRKKGDPAPEELLREDRLRARVEVFPPSLVTPEEAFSAETAQTDEAPPLLGRKRGLTKLELP